MIAAGVGRLVDLARRGAVAIVLAGFVLALGSAYFAATNLAIDTNLQHMLPTDLAWRQNETALDKAFPQNDNLLVVVIDGKTGDLADRAASALADRLRAEPSLFRYVQQPDGGPFFDRNGFLFLPDGVVFANRPPIEETLSGNDPVYLETITEPETKLSVLYREFKNGSTGEVTRNLTTMFDFAPGVKDHVLRITES